MPKKGFENVTLADLIALMESGLPSVIPLPKCVKEGLDPDFAAIYEPYLLPLYQLPSLNGKGIPALMILLMASLPKGTVVVVPSSGNTVMSIALLARFFGLGLVIAMIDETTPLGKQGQIWKADAEIMYPNPGETAIAAAKRVADERGAFFLDQYKLKGSWLSHYEWTLPHIFRETHDEVSAICMAAGTTSMAYGAERYCLDRAPHVQVVGVASMSDEEKVPGSRSPKGLREVGFPYEKLRTPLLANTTKKESYWESLAMIREFCPGGPTLGLQVAGSKRFFQEEWKGGRIGKYLNSENKLHAVHIGMDMHVAYDYRAVLEEK